MTKGRRYRRGINLKYRSIRFISFLLFALALRTHPVWAQSTTVEPRSPTNLLVCSWNIKWFRDTGRDVAKLAKVIAKVDLCGIIAREQMDAERDFIRYVEEIYLVTKGGRHAE